MNASTSAGVSGPVIAAIVTGLVALVVLTVNQYQARQDARRKDFAKALAAVERYAELPYRIRRQQGSTPEVRGRMAEFIHEVQQDLLFHKNWVRIQSHRVTEVYDSLLRATREEAGSAMTEAWNTAPISKDEEMPLGVALSFPRMEEARARYVRAVGYELEFPPFRWIRDYVVPRLVELSNRKASG
ncbi:hypothetical protein GBA63_19020 [Rubrobacter tropicus]|uniref:Uncharacterized protein n=1 Tax=Rubrobacter tropicus TaxID=2653851 RepID=A0A6G8QDN0_9ACTN|nr:hypothetical protein [Rubrobacter tropicus]QIN84501.1 hypothetical protein GBA63_19020 [Rubrobacter tropicus]